MWPDVGTLHSTGKAVQPAFWAAVICAVLTGAAAVLSLSGLPLFKSFGLDIGGVADAGLFGAIAVGLWRGSRVAAWAGLLLYCVERAYMWSTVGPKNPIVAIVFALVFLGGVRGTHALHRLREAALALAQLEKR